MAEITHCPLARLFEEWLFVADGFVCASQLANVHSAQADVELRDKIEQELAIDIISNNWLKIFVLRHRSKLLVELLDQAGQLFLCRWEDLLEDVETIQAHPEEVSVSSVRRNHPWYLSRQ